jgi:hypothetical protein
MDTVNMPWMSKGSLARRLILNEAEKMKIEKYHKRSVVKVPISYGLLMRAEAMQAEGRM